MDYTFTRLRDKNNYSALYETGHARTQSSPVRIRSPNIYSNAVRSMKQITAFRINKDSKIPD